jgi:sec-independent protein translocase protein TatA
MHMPTPAADISLLLAWRIGAPEIILIAVVILLLFGGKKLPELARGLAKGLKGFKEEMRDIESEVDDVKKSITEDSPEQASDAANSQDADDSKNAADQA